MQIERNSANRVTVSGAETLSPCRWLLRFTDPERSVDTFCICTSLYSGNGIVVVSFEETDDPDPLAGQVHLEPVGNWRLRIYEQTSTTNLDPALSGRLLRDLAVFVSGPPSSGSGWTQNATCDPVAVFAARIDAANATITTAPSGGSYVVRLVDVLDDLGAVVDQAEYSDNGSTNPTYLLRHVRIRYVDVAGDTQLYALAAIQGKTASNYDLQDTSTIPRITIYESDGITVHGYVDVSDPSFTLPSGPGTTEEDHYYAIAIGHP